MKNRLLITINLLILMHFLPIDSQCQIIPNQSFEGTPQANIPPSPWQSCTEFSSPDTQPGFWNVTKEASEGNTYIGLVTRGDLGPYGNHNEDAQVRLDSTIHNGVEYNFTIDLAFSKSFGNLIGFESTFLSYANPTKLKIYGGESSCQRTELLWESPTIDHEEWKKYAISLYPKKTDVNYLILAVDYINDSTYFGNILIDNIQRCYLNVNWVSDTVGCEGKSIILDATTTDGSYKWWDGSTDCKHSVGSAGTYSVEVSNGCITKSFEVDVQFRNCYCDTAVPIRTLPLDTMACENTTVTFKASTPGGTYLWDNGSTQPTYTTNQPGTYSVEVSNKCTTKKFNYRVQMFSCECEIKAPNVFTPNGDGINDEFVVSGPKDIFEYHIRIFNRESNTIFESDDIKNSWDGLSNSNLQPAGIYYYTIDISCYNPLRYKKETYNGWISLLR